MPPAWLVSWMDHEGVIFWRTLAVCFVVTGAWELVFPVHRLHTRVERRWGVHAILFALASGFALLTAPASRVAVALTVTDSRFGLLNRPGIPFWIRCAAGILLLDLARYGTHWLMHANPWLWRIHLLHHTDPDVDITTGFRFHPFEVWVGAIVGLATILAAAIPPAAVLLFEIVVGFQAFAAHANASLPPTLERICRPFFITPDLHRIHHSIREDDQSRNLGVLFPFWDRLFGTYRESPADDAKAMTFGLDGFPTDKAFQVPYLLATPFVKLPSPEPAAVPEPLSRRA